ncbi:MAG TPA: hypothetical protein DCE23_05355 [Firmicutes bacterium]|nr:hypothetical protein [Bacillota bacterium]
MEKKHVIFFIILLLLIIGFIIAFNVISDLNDETKIKNEIKEISEVFTIANIDNENVNEILDRKVIKKGIYADIEVGIKQYYKNLYSDLKNLTFLLDADNFTNYLSSKNITEDGPIFLKSRSNLNNSKAQIIEYYDKFTKSLSNNNTKLSYINQNEKKYYIDFYLELTNLALPENFESSLKDEYDNALNNIEIYIKAFDFLYANRSNWEIRNTELVFEDATILDEYMQVIDQLNKTKKEKE